MLGCVFTTKHKNSMYLRWVMGADLCFAHSLSLMAFHYAGDGNEDDVLSKHRTQVAAGDSTSHHVLVKAVLVLFFFFFF